MLQNMDLKEMWMFTTKDIEVYWQSDSYPAFYRDEAIDIHNLDLLSHFRCSLLPGGSKNNPLVVLDEIVEVKKQEAPSSKKEEPEFPCQTHSSKKRRFKQELDKTFPCMSKERKRKPGKYPYTRPKDVGRHFLKVHLKKCFHHILNNQKFIYTTLKNYFLGQYLALEHLEAQQHIFIFRHTIKFQDWLQDLKTTFKDYGKEDFKTAFLVDREKLHHNISLMNEKELSSSLRCYPTDWDLVVYKEILRQLCLLFIRKVGESDSLRFQLANAKNILELDEHLRFILLTEWLIEKPERIQFSEIFGKLWVAKFFNNLQVYSLKV